MLVVAANIPQEERAAVAPPEGLCQGVDVHYEEKCLERDEVALYEDSFYRAKQGKCDRSRSCQAILFPGVENLCQRTTILNRIPTLVSDMMYIHQ
jgi:hypothetical protein